MRNTFDEVASFHHLVRGTILIGFMLFFFKLLLTHDIILLLAPKMVHFIYFTLFIFLILGVLLILRGTSDQEHHYHCHCAGEHSYPPSFMKSLFFYLLFIIPIITGFLFSNNVLNSSVAMNRPIKLGSSSQGSANSNAIQNNVNSKKDNTPSGDDVIKAITKNNGSTPSPSMPDPISQAEYTSIKNRLLQTKNIKMTDDLYVPILNIIQDNVSKMIGKTITTKGFVYREKNFDQDKIIIARFGITCCVADASVYGIMAAGNVAKLPKDKWIEVTGTIEKSNYNGSPAPLLKIQQLSLIAPPPQPYVFDAGVQIE
ncbi:TIGR03943 family putative permease subunit [Bacillus sp. EB600]|uniref:TIGR03943 family putative permease subunit n=1 Tax=Bacillus sp. EB600 TaxID=2806345 RepID=UPI00210DD81F|nr:TIGR03943 family protein [Bacillus sp. EB600]MCQ6280784.1 TIGR03943 family protein [Bacillus sp. EB600]